MIKKLKFLINIFLFKTATNLFEVLLSSQNDGRFKQWITCFAILFNSTEEKIESDYYELLK